MATKTFSKTDLVSAISDATGITKKDVKTVIEVLPGVLAAQLKGDGDSVTLPGIVKIRRSHHPEVTKPAAFGLNKGEMTTFPARDNLRAGVVMGFKQDAGIKPKAA